jgi:hypothetical protein
VRARIQSSFLLRGLAIAALLLAFIPSGLLAADPAVGEFHDVAWAPGDSSKNGAAEMSILMSVARLRQDHSLAGLVCVGNRDGAFHAATEDTLVRVALMGVPVVKLAQSDPMPVNPTDVFIEAGTLAPVVAKRLLSECLARFGAPPAAADPDHPTARELTATRRKLALYQSVFDTANAPRVALR